MPNELKPCPFCGSTAEIRTQPKYDDFWVECAMRNGHCPVMPATWRYKTEEEAINAWETRADNG